MIGGADALVSTLGYSGFNLGAQQMDVSVSVRVVLLHAMGPHIRCPDQT